MAPIHVVTVKISLPEPHISRPFSIPEILSAPPMDSRPGRTTSHGRPIPSYLQPNPLQDPRLETAVEFGDSPINVGSSLSMSVTDANFRTPSEKLKKIHMYIRECGFDTVFDLVDTEIEEIQAFQTASAPIRRERELRKWLQSDGPGAVLSLYVKHGKLELKPSVQECIIVLFTRIVLQEVRNMLGEQSLRRKLHDYTIDTDFSFDAIASAFTTSMPALSRVLHTAFSPASTSGDIIVSQSTSENPQGAASESSPADTPPSDGAHSGSKPQVKGRNLMITAAMAVLGYARSFQVNLFQGYMGYFLYAGKTHKRVIEPLHRLGFSVKYESITSAMKSMAADAALKLRNWKFHIPPTIVVFDNLNYYAKTRDQRVHHQPQLLNYTAVYVAYNQKKFNLHPPE